MGGAASAAHPTRQSSSPQLVKTQRYSLSLGEQLAGGVGKVVAPEPGLDAPHSLSSNFGWFVENAQIPDVWEPYNDESNTRLEAAFVSKANECTVVHQKHLFNVDLRLMEQISSQGQRPRRIRRAPCEATTDPTTGVTTRRLLCDQVTDPFGIGDQEDDAVSNHSVHGALSASFPLLIQSSKPIDGPIFSMAVSPSEQPVGPDVITGGGRGQMRGWNAETMKVETDYGMAPSVIVLNVAYSPSGSHVIAGADDYTASLFSVRKANPVYTLQGHTGKVYGTAFTSCGTTVVTGSMDSTLRLWDTETGTCKRKEAVQTSHVFCVRCSRTQPHFGVSAGNDSLVTVHDFRIPRLVATRCAGHQATVWNVDIHPFDLQFASCGKDRTVRVWDARNTSVALFVLENHIRPVHSVEFIADGSQLLSSGRDGQVVCWSSETGACLWQARAHDSSVFRVCYDRRRSKMLTCGTDSMVNVWRWKWEKTG